jgi:hypothetical protein
MILPSGRELDTISIMLVDDQELIRESLSIVLGMDKELYILHLAENGEIAI